MRLNTKTTLFSAVTTLIMVGLLTGIALISFRQFSISAAKEHTRTAAEIVRVGLTEDMVNGVINKRGNFLKRLAGVPGLLSARVVRSPYVIKQFGPGLPEEHETDKIEKRVLGDGEPYFAIDESAATPVFRATIPFTANAEGTPDCLRCHHVPDHTVLGAVTLRVSVAHLKHSALWTVTVMVLTVGLFGIITVLAYRRMTTPLAVTAADVQEAVGKATNGDFTGNIERRTDDEIGQIAEDFNQLTDFLHKGLSKISDNVSQLIQHIPQQHGNLLTNTISMVESLIDAAHFKQSIEEDETKREVYCRIARVLKEDFHVAHFSLYEVAASKNRLTTVVVDGDPDAGCRWCNPQVMVRADACRAKRTGHLIDSIETPHICNNFAPGDEFAGHTHICLPVLQSGSVGSVVQLVVSAEEGKHYHELIPYIQVYLREAAPVLEAKRLMDTLRESNLRDAMTGLNNRRFLEEYVDTLVAGSARRQSQLAILMLDLDYFKKVNDTYGHDAGDTVLKSLAKVLQQTVRASDLVIRYGGEEFIVILQDVAEDYGDQVAEKIRAAVEQEKIKLPGAVLQKTISIGVSNFPTDADSFWQAVKYADVALYKAKEQGRNRVVHFAPEMWRDDEEY